jgi:hypothetical protein
MLVSPTWGHHTNQYARRHAPHSGQGVAGFLLYPSGGAADGCPVARQEHRRAGVAGGTRHAPGAAATDPPELRRPIKNTIRCQHESLPGAPCGIPLMYRTKGRDFVLSEFVKQATYDQVGGEPCRHVRCPNCGTWRTVIFR